MSRRITTVTNVLKGTARTTLPIPVRRVQPTEASVQNPATLARHLLEFGRAIDESSQVAQTLPMLGGQLITDITVTAGTTILVKDAQTKVVSVLRHGLGRVFQGYEVVRKNADIRVYEPAWVANNAYAAGAYAFATKNPQANLVFQAASTGASAANEPRWPTSPGVSVVDNGVTWVAQAFDPSQLLILVASANGRISLFIW